MRVPLLGSYYFNNQLKIPQDMIEPGKLVFTHERLPYPMPLTMDERGRVFGCRDLFQMLDLEPGDELELAMEGDRAIITEIIKRNLSQPNMDHAQGNTGEDNDPGDHHGHKEETKNTMSMSSVLIRQPDGSLKEPSSPTSSRTSGKEPKDSAKVKETRLSKTQVELYVMNPHLASTVGPGPIHIHFDHNPDWQFTGNYNSRRYITGLAAFYHALKPQVGTRLLYTWEEPTRTMRVHEIIAPTPGSVEESATPPKRKQYRKKKVTAVVNLRESVFVRRRLRYVFLQKLDLEHPLAIPPSSTVDLMIRFMLTQKKTPFEWICAPDDALLRRLGYPVPLGAKSRPDAILLERKTQELLIAAFCMRSSEFIAQREHHDYDVCIAWQDDAKKPGSLPARTLYLDSIR